ncbi:MAG: hypothetical protein A2W19_04895 [Spirochaetes bacterium RBG_16_49_21]|nr:MAG: hypothetical protein A2W19_04895 [Spirochaetes bacterium RBG_16_49_21]
MFSGIIRRALLILMAFGLYASGCSAPTPKNAQPCDDAAAFPDSPNAKKKYLAEGFISDEIFRIVIVSPKDKGDPDMENIKNRAKRRMCASLEGNLSAYGNNIGKNAKTEIDNLIEKNGRLAKKDVDSQRYNVYYFDIVKKDLKSYLKNISCER